MSNDLLNQCGYQTDTPEKPSFRRIMGLVSEAGSDGILLSVLKNRLPGHDPDYLNDAVRRLYMNGEISVNPTGRRYCGEHVARLYATRQIITKDGKPLPDKVLDVVLSYKRPVTSAVIKNRLRQYNGEDIERIISELVLTKKLKDYMPGTYYGGGEFRKVVNRQWLYGRYWEMKYE